MKTLKIMSILFERLALPRDMLIMPSRSLILPKIMTTSGSNCFIEFIMFLAIMLCGILVYSMANIKKRLKGSKDNNTSPASTAIVQSPRPVEPIPESDIQQTSIVSTPLVPLVPAIAQTPPKPKRDIKLQLQLQAQPKQQQQTKQNNKTSKKKPNRGQKKNSYNTRNSPIGKKYKEDERPLTVPPEVYSDVKLKRSSFFCPANRGEESDKENRSKGETNKKDKMSEVVKKDQRKKEKHEQTNQETQQKPKQQTLQQQANQSRQRQVNTNEKGSVAPLMDNSNFLRRQSDMKKIIKASSKYLLTNDDIVRFGFPFESHLFPGFAVFISVYPFTRTDISAWEWMFPQFLKMDVHMVYEGFFSWNFWQQDGLVSYKTFETHSTYTEKKCARCRGPFFQSENGDYLSKSDCCYYHWGRPKLLLDGKPLYSCCQQSPNTIGCVSSFHVWSGARLGVNGPMMGYVKTYRRPRYPFNRKRIYSLDCEMVYTKYGLQVAQVTVVDEEKRVVYDTLVKPEHEVIDYNTRFSGITEEVLCAPEVTKTLYDVQNDLLSFIFEDTILVGHGLENDLRVLKMIHGRIIDTSILFLDNREKENRMSLRNLANLYLKKTIQDDIRGHNSIEDARACMDLVLMKIRSDMPE